MRQLGTTLGTDDELAIQRSLELPEDEQNLLARATVFDVTVQAPFTGDAIKVLLEHRDRIALDVLVPYAAADDSVDIDMDRANAASGEVRLWRPKASAPQ
ncbi:hypothetical protein JGU71_07615 [Antrihabitans sp. YC3-6]|uniref:Uncharacterized protein n=1 Tax=Antrihabitans stalagmiti TaxID=2799499 RepID=A0A934NP70_9NOCA|nr:hypothetical protein [Antrihabitans stalagmiti]MBJ8338750.1 hypothetical protein [Antrihabitans stalagmiti]